MRLAETDHVICFSQSHGLFTTKYKFWFTMSKHLIKPVRRQCSTTIQTIEFERDAIYVKGQQPSDPVTTQKVYAACVLPQSLAQRDGSKGTNFPDTFICYYLFITDIYKQTNTMRNVITWTQGAYFPDTFIYYFFFIIDTYKHTNIQIICIIS